MKVQVIQQTEEKRLQDMENAALNGAMKALILAGVPVKQVFSKAELKKMFGAGRVNEWVENNKLIPHRDKENRTKTSPRDVYLLSEVLQNLI